jgi:hypothetical protein
MLWSKPSELIKKEDETEILEMESESSEENPQEDEVQLPRMRKARRKVSRNEIRPKDSVCHKSELMKIMLKVVFRTVGIA